MTTTTRIVPQATLKQLGFIARLLEEKDLTPEQHASTVRLLEDPNLARSSASFAIDQLMAKPRKKAAVKPAIDEGMYVMHGHVYKVQRAVHGSGNLYAKELLRNSDDTWTFCYQPGAINRLTSAHRMSIEDAKEYGALYGVCCVCGRTLTDEQSISAGIGPICAERF